MDYLKINQEAIKAIFKGTKWGCKIPGYWLDEGHVFITFDGFVGYILPRDKIAFDVKYIAPLDNPPAGLKGLPVQEIVRTNTLYCRTGGVLMRKFKAEAPGEWNVYIDNRYLKMLEKCAGELKFFQEIAEVENMPIRPVVVHEKRIGKFVPVMLITPVNVRDEKIFE